MGLGSKSRVFGDFGYPTTSLLMGSGTISRVRVPKKSGFEYPNPSLIANKKLNVSYALGQDEGQSNRHLALISKLRSLNHYH